MGEVPVQFIQALPYLLTVVLLAGFIGKAVAPQALGKPMTSTVLVKVVGFSDVERHSLNTLFRLSGREGPYYTLWTPDAAGPAQVALIDVDSYEAGLELVSPSFNPNLKMICVGAEAPTLAWRNVQRPVDWAAMVGLLDELFVGTAETAVAAA
eukprot:gene14952-31749_t